MDVPGLTGNLFSTFSATVVDGPTQTLALGLVYKDQIDDETQSVLVAVRSKDRNLWSLLRLNDSIADESTFEDSERYAKNLAREWHLERYSFSHWEKPGRFKSRIPVYRYDGAWSLTAKPGARRYFLDLGAPTLALTASTVLPSQDPWDQGCAEVEEACASFEKVLALLPGDTFAQDLGLAREAVETYRVEARRLAALGQALAAIPSPNGAIQERILALQAQLSTVRDGVLTAVAQITDVQLVIPTLFPNLRKEMGKEDLQVVRDGALALAEG